MIHQEDALLQVLTDAFVDLAPREVAAEIERWPVARAASLVGTLDADRSVSVASRLRPDAAGDILSSVSTERAALLLQRMDPARAAPIVARIDMDPRRRILDSLTEAAARELGELMSFPLNSAASIMDAQVTTFRPSSTVGQVLARLRALRSKRVQYVFVVDDDDLLLGAVPLQDLAVAEPNDELRAFLGGAAPSPSVQAMSSQSEVVDILGQHRITALPVVDATGRLVGVIRSEALFRAAKAEASVDLQTMVGASKEERALSSSMFAVRKRLPWLNVNLLTAFLAAAVVGLFEDTIARFTMLAILLPVVAGQSGNTGAQALAVTMRGLALREVRLRHWWRIALKEVSVGAVNGVAIAAVTGVSVLFWSGSSGLAAVVAVSMVLSMTIAGLAGASVPMVLTMFRQDPAQASSIILTTVTDVMGFLSFLGLATLASSFL